MKPIILRLQWHQPEHWYQRPTFELLEDIELFRTKVPKGFITDGASIPRQLYGWFNPVGRYFAAAIKHDYLLTTLCPDDLPHDAALRRECDYLFLDALRELGISVPRRVLMYMAVRGWSRWVGFTALWSDPR